MAFSFSKANTKELTAMIDAAKAASAELDEAVEEYNSIAEPAFADLQEKLENFKDALDPLRELIKDRVETWREQFDKKSAKWRDSEEGQDVASFLSDWESFAETLDSDAGITFVEPEELRTEQQTEWDEIPSTEV